VAFGERQRRGGGLAFRFHNGQPCAMNAVEADNRTGKLRPLSRLAALLWLIASLLLASAPVHARISADASPVVLSPSTDIPAILQTDSASTYLSDARRLSVWTRSGVRKFSGGLAGGTAFLLPPNWAAEAPPPDFLRDFGSADEADQKTYRYFDPQGPPPRL